MSRVEELAEEFGIARPETSIALDPDDLVFMLALCAAAGAYRIPSEHPVGGPIHIENENGSEDTIQLTDKPYNRMMFAIREHCGEDSRKFFAAMWRIGALLDLYRDERMRPFVVNENDSVHPCIAEVASTMSVNKRGHFNAKKFFERARQLAMERFPSHQLPNITE
ncbi:MAG: hypothetical protein ACYCRE_13780 [Acidobacteriaceae bacterium]